MKSIFMAILLAAGVALAHHVPVEPPLPDRSTLTSPGIGFYSPPPLDQSMFPALHPDSTYQYVSIDSIRSWYIAVVRKDGKLTAQRILGWGGWHKHHEDDPSFRIRGRANFRYSETVSENVTKDHYVWLFDVRNGGRYNCQSAANKVRALKLFTITTGEGRAIDNETVYLGVDYWPYYPDLGYTKRSDIVGIITGHQEEYPWNFSGHDTTDPYNHSPHGCGWTLPSWYRLEEEEYDIPPLDLPPQTARQVAPGTTPPPRPGDELRPVPWRPQ